MTFFFLPDFRKRYRFISSEPVHEIHMKFSRWKKIWEEARRRLMLLPPRILRQEQAFEAILNHSSPQVEILLPAGPEEKRIHRKFFFFIQRQRSLHVALLIVETVLLPISGLMALLPGPNIFFGILALIMFAHWRGLRGINRLAGKKICFRPSPLLQEWADALEKGQEAGYADLLSRIEKEYDLPNLRKVLYR